MKMIAKGSKVKVHYTGRLTNEEVFDTSLEEGREPLEFIIGEGQLIPGFEIGILGLKTGDKKTIEIEPQDAYGEYRNELLNTVPKTRVPSDVQVGQILQSVVNEQMVEWLVKEIKENDVIIDANHPLAGKKLIFEVEIVDVV